MPHDPMLKSALLLIGTLALAGCAFEQAVRRGQEEWEREQQRRADPTRAGIVSSPAQVPKSFENNDSFVLQVWNLEPAAIPTHFASVSRLLCRSTPCGRMGFVATLSAP